MCYFSALTESFLVNDAGPELENEGGNDVNDWKLGAETWLPAPSFFTVASLMELNVFCSQLLREWECISVDSVVSW